MLAFRYSHAASTCISHCRCFGSSTDGVKNTIQRLKSIRVSRSREAPKTSPLTAPEEKWQRLDQVAKRVEAMRLRSRTQPGSINPHAIQARRVFKQMQSDVKTGSVPKLSHPPRTIITTRALKRLFGEDVIIEHMTPKKPRLTDILVDMSRKTKLKQKRGPGSGLSLPKLSSPQLSKPLQDAPTESISRESTNEILSTLRKMLKMETLPKQQEKSGASAEQRNARIMHGLFEMEDPGSEERDSRYRDRFSSDEEDVWDEEQVDEQPFANEGKDRDMKKVIRITKPMSVRDYAELLQRSSAALLDALRADWGVDIKHANEIIPNDVAELLLTDEGFEVTLSDGPQYEPTYADASNKARPTVVCIMGHVDHGKTTLLDKLRRRNEIKSNLAAKEHGAITQSIGAFNVRFNNISDDSLRPYNQFTFLDTPGHAAFHSMRSWGAMLTDIVVLVVSAADGVKPQTLEAIQLFKKYQIPAIVAVNKMDIPGSDADVIATALAEHGVVSEEHGGTVTFQSISALKNNGLDDLQEALALQASMLEPRAPVEGPGQALIVECRQNPRLGLACNCIVKKGTFRVGDLVISDRQSGRIRAIYDENENSLQEATPGMAVSIIGIEGLDNLGDDLQAVPSQELLDELLTHRSDEREWLAEIHSQDEFVSSKRRMVTDGPVLKMVRKLVRLEDRRNKLEEQKDHLIGARLYRTTSRLRQKAIVELMRMLKDRLASSNMDASEEACTEELDRLRGIVTSASEGTATTEKKDEALTKADPFTLQVIIRADVKGSLQAIMDYLEKLPRSKVRVNVIHSGLGQATVADLNIAQSCGAQIISFNPIEAGEDLMDSARRLKVPLYEFKIIFQLFDHIRDSLAALLPKKVKDIVLGAMNIQKKFGLHGKRRVVEQYVAGGTVKMGKLLSSDEYKWRVKRDGEVIADSLILSSIKQHTDAVQEVDKGQQCGVLFKRFYDFEEGDTIECYELKEEKVFFNDLPARGIAKEGWQLDQLDQ